MKRRISKLDSLVKEMVKIHKAYQALKEHSENRELPKKSARAKLQGEIAQLAQMNRELRKNFPGPSCRARLPSRPR